MSKVMEVEVREVDVSPDLVPDAPEARAPETTDEDPAVRAVLGELVQMRLQVRDDLRRDRHHATTGPGLGRVLQELTAVQLGQGTDHAHDARVQVEMLPPQPGQLSPAQTRERAEEDERSAALQAA
ncbi:hypothetical protein [Actinomadura sp. 7K507]|uniref:hypothetical protein n=1 Tax=Actinomadura sp. 7K507 TaxID=2530365 RepID=UPI001FB62B73|nr:hypothetical protein [Actinomadura sp. 7K507]